MLEELTLSHCMWLSYSILKFPLESILTFPQYIDKQCYDEMLFFHLINCYVSPPKFTLKLHLHSGSMYGWGCLGVDQDTRVLSLI
jgi:hypothetical protein